MNAIGYIRLSRKGQSKYSFDGQEAAIKAYCLKYGLQLLSIFRDNGECSDTFNRTNFKALEHFLCHNKGKVKYLIVMDHDRFSRDLSKALFKINELKRRHGVTVLSTEEPIELNTSDPQVFISRTLKYAMANLELLNIRNRLKRGIKNAMESGRFVRRAPFGYQNDRDVSDRSILSIKENEAPIVQKIFQDYLAGVPLFLIYKEIRRLGFPNTGNGSVRRALQNCVYAGLIKVHPFEDNTPTYVRALHEPIIAEKDYWLAQSKLNKKHTHRTQPREDFPLRGILSCECGLNMTAGWSKGKTKRYLYYRCIKHSSINLPGTILHEKFIRLLHHLRFSANDLNFLKELSKQKLTVALRINARQLSAHNPDTANEVDRNNTEAWSKGAEWLGLEITGTEAGQAADETGVVEFVARYKIRGVQIDHRERALFKKHGPRWVFVDGVELKGPPVRNTGPQVGRNDPCPCGSGKKYKKCHGA